MEDNRRKFMFEDKNFFISTPTAEDIKNADWSYSKTYTRSLKDGLFTTAEMQDNLIRRGILGKEYEMRKEELEGILSQKIINLARVVKREDKQKLALEVAKAREELFKWNQRTSGPLSNTCEQLSDDSRLEYLTSRLIENEDGSKVWEVHEDFVKEKNQAFAMACRFQVMMFLYGMQPDFIENTPEAIAMREIEQELLEDAKKTANQEAVDALREEAGVESKEEVSLVDLTEVPEEGKKKKGGKKPK